MSGISGYGNYYYNNYGRSLTPSKSNENLSNNEVSESICVSSSSGCSGCSGASGIIPDSLSRLMEKYQSKMLSRDEILEVLDQLKMNYIESGNKINFEYNNQRYIMMYESSNDSSKDIQTTEVIKYSNGNKSLETITIKDTDGNVVSKKQIYYNPDGSMRYSANNEYKDGAISKVTEYEPDCGIKDKRSCDKTTVTCYDENGKKTLTTNELRYEDGSLESSSVIKYDDNGVRNTREIKHYDSEGNVESTEIKYYDANGKIIEKTDDTLTETVEEEPAEETKETTTETIVNSRYPNGNKSVETTIEKDSAGNVVSEKKTTYKEDGSVRSYTFDEYEDGVKVKQSKTEVHDYKSFISEETSVKDSNNKLIAQKEARYNLDGSLIKYTLNEYEDGILAKQTQYDSSWGESNGRKYNSTSVDYFDKDGNKTLRTWDFRYNDNGSLRDSSITTYSNGKEKTKRAISYDKDGNVESANIQYYDASGRYTSTLKEATAGIIGETATETIVSTDINGCKTETTIIKDSNENAISIKENKYNPDGSLSYSTLYEYENNMVKYSEFNPDGSVKSYIYKEYENDVIAKQTKYSAVVIADDGREYNSTEVICYNEKGEETSRTKEEKYNEDGSIKSNTIGTIIYDKFGYIETDETKYYNGNGKLESIKGYSGGEHPKEYKEVYTENSDGTITATMVVNHSSGYKDEIVTIKGSDDKIISRNRTTYRDDGSVYNYGFDEYKDGVITKSITYTPHCGVGYGTTTDQISVAYYDKNGNKTVATERCRYNDSGNLFSTNTSTYYEYGDVKSVRDKNYDRNGNVTSENTKYYGKKINYIETDNKITNEQDNEPITETATINRPDGKKIEIISVKTPNGELISEKETVYNQDGSLLSYTFDEYEDNAILKHTFYFSDFGSDDERKYNITVTTCYDHGNKISNTREERYNDNGNLKYTSVDEKQYNGNLQSTIKEYHDNGKVKSERQNYYDSVGAIDHVILNLYDERGYVIDSSYAKFK